MSEPSVDGYLRRAEVGPDQGWAVLRWLMAWGADEFSIEVMGIQGLDSPRTKQIGARLARHSLGTHDRERLTAPGRAEFVRPTPIFRLNHVTASALRDIFPGGLFQHPASEDEGGWIEDPSFYRSGDLVLSIVSHESEGMLRLPVEDYHRISTELGLSLHPNGVWI